MKWTIDKVRAANTSAGYFFFSPNTMKFFGDTIKSFKVDVQNDVIYIVRVKPMYDNHNGRSMGGVGDRRIFDPVTGSIGSVIRSE